jgi:PAS domain S-box-containing protein
VPVYLAVSSFREEEAAICLIVTDLTQQKQYEELRAVEHSLRSSEERFRHAILESPVPLMLLAEDGQVMLISRSWTELTGYTQEQISTITAWTSLAYDESLRGEVEAGIQKLFGLDRRVDEGEFVIRTSTGEHRIWDFSTSPLGRLPDGRRLVLSTAKDVTHRKRAERELAKNEERYRIVVEAAQVTVWDWDLAADVTEWNEGLTSVFGWPSGRIPYSERWWLERIHPEERERVARTKRQNLENGSDEWTDEYRFRRADGSWAVVSDLARLVRDKHGKPVRMQ